MNILTDSKQLIVLAAVIMSLAAVSCSKDYLEPAPVRESEGLRLTLGGDMTRSGGSDAILDGMRLYSFAQSGTGGTGDGGGANSPFHHIVSGLTRASGSMTLKTTQMRTGKWDLVMVSPCGATLTPPIVTTSADNALMYTFNPADNGGQAYEFYHRYHRLPEIMVNTDHSVTSGLSRNVAKVQIVVDRAVDVNTASSAHTITLDGVPSKISWAGTLLKSIGGNIYQSSTSDFDVLPAGTIKGNITFTTNESETGTFKSDMLTFIVPAHRGSDFWSNPSTQNTTPRDTITKKMNLSVSFTKASGGTFTKSVEVPMVARCNEILILKLRMQDVNVEVIPSIEPWSSQPISGDIRAPYLNVTDVETVVYRWTSPAVWQTTRFHFWSNQTNQSEVYVEAMSADAIPVNVNSVFDNLAGVGATNMHYNTATGEGYIDIINKNGGTTDIKIYLKAGNLRREITVKHKYLPIIDGFRVAVTDALPVSGMRWLEAMGLDLDPYTPNYYWGSTAMGPFNIGCNAYSEPGYPTGWRVPTLTELQSMHTSRTTLESIPGFTLFSTGNPYWSCTETSSITSWYVYFTDGIQLPGDVPDGFTVDFMSKSVSFQVRCVRDVTP